MVLAHKLLRSCLVVIPCERDSIVAAKTQHQSLEAQTVVALYICVNEVFMTLMNDASISVSCDYDLRSFAAYAIAALLESEPSNASR